MDRHGHQEERHHDQRSADPHHRWQALPLQHLERLAHARAGRHRSTRTSPSRRPTCRTRPTAAPRRTPSPKDTWISERSSGNNDVDWFEFHIAKKQKITIRVADQPISLKAELYKGCSTRLASVNAPGRNDDVITRTLGPGTYRVRITSPSNGWSGSPYRIRFLRR